MPGRKREPEDTRENWRVKGGIVWEGCLGDFSVLGWQLSEHWVCAHLRGWRCLPEPMGDTQSTKIATRAQGRTLWTQNSDAVKW